MGYITGAFGIRGWVKVQALTAEAGGLLDYGAWWIGDDSGWRRFEVEKAQAGAGAVSAKLAGCEDREAAARFRGQQVAVSRGEFPAAGDNEFYWADLIGLKVVNTQGEDLGTVSRVFETGANDVLVVEGERERLVPFIEDVVREVDLEARVLRVEWGADY